MGKTPSVNNIIAAVLAKFGRGGYGKSFSEAAVQYFYYFDLVRVEYPAEASSALIVQWTVRPLVVPHTMPDGKLEPAPNSHHPQWFMLGV